MSHPYFHALSSARRLGGEGADYLGVHAWFDASKATYADTRHRAVLHHTFGAALLLDRIGAVLTRASDGAVVPVATLGTQHLVEDCGFEPTLADWLAERPADPWIVRGLEAPPPAAYSVQRFGGQAGDYAALHAWLDQGTAWWADPRAHAPLHNTFGVFLAEQRFGTTLVRADGKHVPTRLVAEAHVTRAHGFLPTVEHWMGAVPVQRWMRRGALPLSRMLESPENPTNPQAQAATHAQIARAR